MLLLSDVTGKVLQSAVEILNDASARSPRILLTGTPVGFGSEKVLRFIDEGGASVVVMENCSGYKKFFTVNENGDPLRAIAEPYLQIPCSCMSPNPGRYELLGRLIEEFQVDGVLDLSWQACHTYNIESHLVVVGGASGVVALNIGIAKTSLEFVQCVFLAIFCNALVC